MTLWNRVKDPLTCFINAGKTTETWCQGIFSNQALTCFQTSNLSTCAIGANNEFIRLGVAHVLKRFFKKKSNAPTTYHVYSNIGD